MSAYPDELAEKLKNGAVGVLATDTLYGLVGSALSAGAIRKIYRLRKRGLKKPMIILVGSPEDLKVFHIKLDKTAEKFLKKFWPGKVSVVLPCPYKKFEYLHRGTESLAFRLPKKTGLLRLLKKTGPLVAPSANLEGIPPAKNIKEAKKYFGNKIDFYIDEGRKDSLPSTLVAVGKGRISVLREGAVKIKE